MPYYQLNNEGNTSMSVGNQNPDDVFRHAMSFLYAIDQLHRTSNQDRIQQILGPIAVQSAFASELFFKAAICFETGSTVKGHLLYDLFMKLSPVTRGNLIVAWDVNQVGRKDILDRLDKSAGLAYPRDLETNLKQGSDAFRQIRYIYEGGNDFVFLLSDLPLVLWQVLRELKPEWKSMSI